MKPVFRSHQEIFELAAAHLHAQRRSALLPGGGGAYRGACGGCPIGSFISPRDYTTAMEGVPVRYVAADAHNVPVYMHAGIAALRKALRRAHIDVDDVRTVSLLSCLQNVHDAFGVWEWSERLHSIARQFGLEPSAALIEGRTPCYRSFHRHTANGYAPDTARSTLTAKAVVPM
jgi:hypothetical protein